MFHQYYYDLTLKNSLTSRMYRLGGELSPESTGKELIDICNEKIAAPAS